MDRTARSERAGTFAASRGCQGRLSMRTAKTSVDSTHPRLGADGTSGSDKLLALIAGGLIGIACIARQILFERSLFGVSELRAATWGRTAQHRQRARASAQFFSAQLYPDQCRDLFRPAQFRTADRGRAIRAHWRERTTASLSAGQRRGLLGPA